MKRSSGILLPVFSIPSKYGIGTFGEESFRFIDYLYEMGISFWQILPLNPIYEGNSPYQSPSCFSGCEYYIDLDLLMKDKLLYEEEYANIKFCENENKVNYDLLRKERDPLLMHAAERFIDQGIYKEEYKKFKKDFKFSLDKYALFILFKKLYNDASIKVWDNEYRDLESQKTKEIIKENKDFLEKIKVIQFLFFKQWINVKTYANDKGIKIIGDLPIYSAYESAECFFDYKNFLLENGHPKVVGGCPPDGFSIVGQVWNNPIYDYEYMEKDNFSYMVERMKIQNILYDVVRLDHFRGYDYYYAIPYGNTDGLNGEWHEGPRLKLFDIIKKKFKNLDIIAEDLGARSDSLEKLLSDTNFPRMNVLEFAFDMNNPFAEPFRPYLPENYSENSVSYLGTHDNDTITGYINNLNEGVRHNIEKHFDLTPGTKYNESLIKKLFESKSNLAIIQLQDLLDIGSSGRINTPGTVSDSNWSFRLDKNYINDGLINFMRELVVRTGRIEIKDNL